MCRMAFGRKEMGALWCVVAVGLLVAPILAQGPSGQVFPTAVAPVPTAATTPEMGFFQKIYHAAKGLVWSDSSNATQPMPTGAPLFPSPTSAATVVNLAQVGHVKVIPKLNFSLRVLDENLSVAAEPGTYAEGATIRVEARVQAGLGLFPTLFVEECYGTDARHPSQSRRAYIIADNHGCLYANDSDATWFRKGESAIVLALRTPAVFLEGESEEMYIHCALVAWSQKMPSSPGKKACYFDRLSSGWRNLDPPSKGLSCWCCDSFCPPEPPPHGNDKAFWGEGRRHRVATGPLRLRKDDVPWFEGRCRTMKQLVLVCVAFVGSCVLAALLAGALLGLAVAFFRSARAGRWPQLMRRLRRRGHREEPPYHLELQTVAEALATSEEIERESTLDYCRLQSDAPPEQDA